jgi:uncharacterized membrane protein
MTNRNRISQRKILSSALHPFHGAFGSDTFGRRAEMFARMFGTPKFLIAQTAIVAAWIAVNVLVVTLRWDPYPFILLNLAFSLQAAYAAPLILLAQTRQADRDKAINEADTKHREELAAETIEYLEQVNGRAEALRHLLDLNTHLTKEISRLTTEIHQSVTAE